MVSIDTILTRRVEKILPAKAGLKKLLQDRTIRLYQGFDPTAKALHLGHTIGMRKLMDFANLGHQVIFLFGTGTVLVGDPSERSTGRTLITQEEIDENIKTWKKQVEKIVDFKRVTIKQNGDWLTKLTLTDLIGIASQISAVQLFKRESFQRRLKQGDTVWYHETMYPLLQGYDSVVMDVDLEIGGTDQEFNMLIGRELQHKLNNRDKYILTTPMILGTDGRQMSKTSGNCIWLADTADDMYGKTMRIPDSQIPSYWELLTDLPLKSDTQILNDPLQAKKQLAFDITRQFHGKNQAIAAQNHFESVIQAGQIPDQIPASHHINLKHLKPVIEKTGPNKSQLQVTILDILKHAPTQASTSQVKRTVAQGGVEYNGNKIANNQVITPRPGDIIKFGKRTFFKITG